MVNVGQTNAVNAVRPRQGAARFFSANATTVSSASQPQGSSLPSLMRSRYQRQTGQNASISASAQSEFAPTQGRLAQLAPILRTSRRDVPACSAETPRHRQAL